MLQLSTALTQSLQSVYISYGRTVGDTGADGEF